MFRPLTTIFLATLCLHLPAAQGESVPKEKTDVIPIAKIPDISPAKPGQFDRAFRRGVDFLLKTQNKDGSWGDHRVIGTWNILCPYPDGPLTFKTASTALCIAGLNAYMLPPLPDGVTPSYIHFLDVIEQMEKNGTSVKVSDISDALNLPRPGVTRTVKEMEKKGYLTKKPSEEDARIMYLSITGEGKKLSAKYNEQVFNALLPEMVSSSGTYFARRERELGELLTMFKKPDKTALRNLQVGVLCEFWNCNSKLSEAYRKIFVPIPRGFDDIFGRKSRFDTITKSESVLTVNAFAEEKIGDLYLQEALFHSLAVEAADWRIFSAWWASRGIQKTEPSANQP